MILILKCSMILFLGKRFMAIHKRSFIILYWYGNLGWNICISQFTNDSTFTSALQGKAKYPKVKTSDSKELFKYVNISRMYTKKLDQKGKSVK